MTLEEVIRLLGAEIGAALRTHLESAGSHTGQPAAPNPPRAYTAAQVAEFLQLPVKQVYALIQRRELSAIKVGRHYRVPAAELERYLYRAPH